MVLLILCKDKKKINRNYNNFNIINTYEIIMDEILWKKKWFFYFIYKNKKYYEKIKTYKFI